MEIDLIRLRVDLTRTLLLRLMPTINKAVAEVLESYKEKESAKKPRTLLIETNASQRLKSILAPASPELFFQLKLSQEITLEELSEYKVSSYRKLRGFGMIRQIELQELLHEHNLL